MARSELVTEFFEKHPEYHHLGYEKISGACRFPFKYIKKMMAREDLPDIRIQYFGVFRPLKGRLKGLLAGLEEQLSNGELTEEEFNIKALPILNRLKQEDNE